MRGDTSESLLSFSSSRVWFVDSEFSSFDESSWFWFLRFWFFEGMSMVSMAVDSLYMSS